ncbi:hypothetical protein Aeqsu_2587 [Aequorivita sublithincola DSM 14238]|uniref:Uncharacterized protein n=1 Tax=Aequorivita sublithincola (strain DSM 14238 / LMG 21431 / ACAM 643 / 9-3) TaxID=746697 RepID=I3YYH4_AEQSU|nr:hypothetical protein [Aequorivita sublithincola]AFL82042.1 hypothetical protein Aeqsu_2587 [Aequorivita sublithincola DSM 14238]
MKKLLFLLLIFPLIASAQLDFETNKYKLDFVKLPEIESLMSTPINSNSDFSAKYSKKLPSFKLSKENYREAVSMLDVMATHEGYVKSDLKISLDPKEYGVYGGNSSYSADGSTAVKNISYKESRSYLRPELMPYSYGFYQRPRRSGFYVGYGVYGTPSQ